MKLGNKNWQVREELLFRKYPNLRNSPTGRLGVPQLPPLQNIPAPRTKLGDEIRKALHGPFTCPACGGDCETLLAALKTSLAGGAR